MIATANRWGTEIGLSLSKSILERFPIEEKTRLNVEIDGERLIISRVPIRKHITLAERLKDWDGEPYELTDEDREWLDMKPVGEEIID
ncbi:MAG: hypothetical protein LBN42_02020 [Oscillospiraceae bacterium]|jgi:antitoxin component of MazEF toxin-antitoxin module|nr:hypothetical protein [Oscillospiraceae bacterium]